MPKFTSWQLFGLMVLVVAVFTALDILGKVDTSIVVGVLLSALGIGAHVSGVNTAVPLSAAAAGTVLSAALDTTRPAADAAPVAAAAPASIPAQPVAAEPQIVETPA